MTFSYAFLLTVLLLLFLLEPVAEVTRYGYTVLQVLSTAVLVAGGLIVGDNRRLLIVVLLLALPSLVLGWSSSVAPSALAAAGHAAFAGAFVAFVASLILIRLLKEEEITADTIIGGICVYLLIGLFFFQLFTLIEFVRPQSFLGVDSPGAAGPASAPLDAWIPELLYFSFATLTTLGYGDITPATAPPRTLAALEAVIGQVYLTVLVARLVGLHISQRRNPER